MTFHHFFIKANFEGNQQAILLYVTLPGATDAHKQMESKYYMNSEENTLIYASLIWVFIPEWFQMKLQAEEISLS